MDPKSIRLTRTVNKGGCAAKLPAGTLRAALSQLGLKNPPELKVGLETLDDACLWDLGDGRLLVKTLDFFTPIVDDAEDFGAIAAANALSDVYAMGGEPKIALTILAFPTATLPIELLQPLMGGAISKITEAGACLAGGHSIDDETLKLGFSVTGFVDQGRVWTNSKARPGDHLILTKGLGTGTLTTALKLGELDRAYAKEAIESMKQLNRIQDLIDPDWVHSATDITGFGLAGHAMQMAQASSVGMRIKLQALPELPGALALIRDEYLNRAHKSNREYTRSQIQIHPEADEARVWLSHDPQTSGGLLLSVDPKHSDELLSRVQARFPRAARIGEVTGKNEFALQFSP